MLNEQSAVSSDLIFHGAYLGKRVLITGHTGFKGAWLSAWLQRLGAQVVGYALPPSEPSLFDEARIQDGMTHVIGDVRDRTALEHLLETTRPEIVFHLAAQPLVRYSYREPVETFETNVMGTVNLLDAVRTVGGVRACVVVTSDKCYDNREIDYAYREDDAMGGYDPYSASKGCAELVVSAYRNSFFNPERLEDHGLSLASVRAGNVIGGGDWAEDRILPDTMRALMASEPIQVRNPHAIRPWQHVLEPLSGYLWLGAEMLRDPAHYAQAWNFGPDPSCHVTVRDLVTKALQAWGGEPLSQVIGPQGVLAQPHEATYLKLDITKASSELQWNPILDIDGSLRLTVDWYRFFHLHPERDTGGFTREQIAWYERLALAQGVSWAISGKAQ